jgi:predicted permease
VIGKRLDAAVPIGQQLDPRFRDTASTSRLWSARRVGDVRVHESLDRIVGPIVTAVLGSVVLVLLVVCTNLANLLLARGASRRHEMAVRLSLGASRWRLLREQMAESTVLAVAGAALGILVARALVVLLARDFQAGDTAVVTLSVRPELNPAVIAWAIAVSALALLVFGVVPAWHSTRGHLRDLLASDTTGGAMPRWRGRRILIASQVAVSVALLAVTAITIDRVAGLAVHDPGFNLDKLALATIDLSLTGVDETEGRIILDRSLETSRHSPGVAAATLGSGLPIGSSSRVMNVSTTDNPLNPPSGYSGSWMVPIIAAPTFFDVVGIRIIAGRGFNVRDTANGLHVVVLSELAALRLFGAHDQVGQMVHLKRQPMLGAPDTPLQDARVVGIAKDTDVGSLGERGSGVVYLPYAQHFASRMALIARASTDPAPLVRSLHAALVDADREVTIVRETTAAGLASDGQQLLSIVAGVSGLLGAFALLLSLIGLHGVLSFLVTRRTREIGLRMALGASPGQVRRMVLVDGLRPVVWGLAAGMAAGALLLLNPVFSRPLQSSSLEPALAVPLLMLATGTVAVYWPARRASRTDPSVALRNL